MMNETHQTLSYIKSSLGDSHIYTLSP